MTGNNFHYRDLTSISRSRAAGRKTVMNNRITESSEPIDRKTSRSICDAVGERLQQTLHPDSSRLSSHLQHLIDELRKRDADEHGKASH
jgi:hypothetical protein